MSVLMEIVNEQANDAGLWFIARTAPEAYLQQELRRLHHAIEQISSTSEEIIEERKNLDDQLKASELWD